MRILCINTIKVGFSMPIFNFKEQMVAISIILILHVTVCIKFEL